MYTKTVSIWEEVIPDSISFLDIAPEECKMDLEGSSYVGSKNTTPSCLSCQRWDTQSPHTHTFTASDLPDETLSDAGNMCRNPNQKADGPWCYTTHSDTEWEYCDIPLCK
jgi:integrin beta 3